MKKQDKVMLGTGDGNSGIVQISIPVEHFEYLKQFVHELKTQNNHYTESPVYLVYSKKRERVSEDMNRDGKERCECSYPCDDCLEYEEEHGELPDDCDQCERCYYKEEHQQRHNTCHAMLRSSAEDLMKRKAHDLVEPYIYADSNYWCPETIPLKKAIFSIFDSPKHLEAQHKNTTT